MTWLDEVQFDADGLVPVIAQDTGSARVLMVAWANRDALAETAGIRRCRVLVALTQAFVAQG